MTCDLAQLFELAQRASGVRGVDARELTNDAAAPSKLSKMAKRGIVRQEGPCRARVYFADPCTTFAAEKAAADARAREAHAENTQQVRPRLTSKARTAPASRPAAKAETRTIDGREVKVTICPSFVDMRFTVTPAEHAPIFSTLRPGRYLRSESWAARVWGDKR